MIKRHPALDMVVVRGTPRIVPRMPRPSLEEEEEGGGSAEGGASAWHGITSGIIWDAARDPTQGVGRAGKS